MQVGIVEARHYKLSVKVHYFCLRSSPVSQNLRVGSCPKQLPQHELQSRSLGQAPPDSRPSPVRISPWK